MSRAISGMLGLAGLAVALRGRFGGRYWRWRMSTAYGSRPPRGFAMAREALLFGAWRRRVTRLGSGGAPRRGA